MGTFTLWAGGDAHVGTDLRNDRRSLETAILQAEKDFEWDVMLDIGDLSGAQAPPDDDEGEEVVRQYGVSTKHPRSHFYNIVGNHDASGPDEETQWWFKKWVSPIGESIGFSWVHADHRPFPVEGTWERYSFRAGNVLFLMMGDRNDFDPPISRGTKSREYPAGCVTRETFE
ncbi:MAG: hypothetical protein QGG64_22525 [Candidatus Latescibacteria bacterium]|nr:hypothetical protein [Candidatus Latescibacterota bacterium]